MRGLQRHGLVRLSEAGWDGVLAGTDWDDAARSCLAAWRRGRLPLVVARQDGVSAGRVRLGLPAPPAHGRQRLALAASCGELLDAGDAFPEPEKIASLLPDCAQASWRALAGELAPLALARVFGSYGWEHLSGLSYVHPDSDVDLLLRVDDVAAADAVAALLACAPLALPRLDGEIAFADGSAIAWREWRQWRAGNARGMLVKGIAGVRIVHDLGWLVAAACDPGSRVT